MPTVGELERAGWRFMRPNELWSPKKIRESEVDAAVRLGLDRYSIPIPLRDIPLWLGDGRLPGLRDEILEVWRGQHPKSPHEGVPLCARAANHDLPVA